MGDVLVGDNEEVDSEYRDYYIESLVVLYFSLDLLNGHFYFQVYYSIGLFSLIYDF